MAGFVHGEGRSPIFPSVDGRQDPRCVRGVPRIPTAPRARRIICAGAAAVAVALFGSSIGPAQEKQDGQKKQDKTQPEAEPKSESLIDPKGLSEIWAYHSSESDTKLEDTWSIKSEKDAPVLICKGKPPGYIRTRAAYDNFRLELEWMYPDDSISNSGVLLHCEEKDKVWPSSIQVQLHRPFVGSIFPLNDAKSDNRVQNKGLKLETGKWNTCRIECRGDKITVWINDVQMGQVSGCEPRKGYIALQSEGSEIRFRKIGLVAIEPNGKSKKTETTKSDPAKKKKSPTKPDRQNQARSPE